MEKQRIVGANLARLRAGKGLSYNALARASGVSRTTLIHWEAGQHIAMRIDTLERVAQALGVDMVELMTAQ